MKWINKLLLSIVWVGLVASCSDDDSHELPVISPVSTGTFTDTRDDNTYNYVRIGNLEWMTENCRYRTSDCKYYVDYGNTGQTNPSDVYSDRYGFLYTLLDAPNAVPEGWRIPTDEDFKQLERALGMSAANADELDWRGGGTGTLMRQAEEGTRLNFQVAGYYTPYMIMQTPGYRFMGAYGFYWTSTKDESKNGEYYFYRKLYYESDQVYRQSIENNAQYLSLRLVRNAQ